jgi:DNA-binding LytR/AlgR family response regulator
MHQNGTTTLFPDFDIHAVGFIQQSKKSFSNSGCSSLSAGPAVTSEAVMAYKPEFLFPDVEMSEIDRLDLHEKILPHQPCTAVAYVTGHERCGLKNLKIKPCHFIQS